MEQISDHYRTVRYNLQLLFFSVKLTTFAPNLKDLTLLRALSDPFWVQEFNQSGI